jgi:nucleoside-diphosphate-sugar epimerase
MEKILVTGAGGFIGGHLVKELLNREYSVRAVDIKPLKGWYQVFNEAENFALDMSIKDNCFKMAKSVDGVMNMACNMGGMGFIENNKAECMLSVLVNTHMLMACKEHKVKKYFFSSSACVYNKDLQDKPDISGLKESDAYPANPEDGYGWEKLFSERMCGHYLEDYGLDVKVARYHNVYGPNGTYDGGREKAPAALCRKIIIAKEKNLDIIDVWGDGKQTRSFLFIEDCVNATLQFFNSDHHGPINIGSEEKVSINEMIEKIEKITNKEFKKNYQLDKPKGVRGRSSNNDLIRKLFKWEPKYNLYEGLKKTYQWIEEDMKKKLN